MYMYMCMYMCMYMYEVAIVYLVEANTDYITKE
jgi:hypothetical protein